MTPTSQLLFGLSCILRRQDRLTGLPDRHRFVRRLRRALGRLRSGCALLLVDLDHFTQVNASYGHDCGDRLLRAVAQRLAASLPRHVTLARFGADVFAVCAPGAGRAVGEACARAVLAALEQPFLISGQEIVQQASIGIALYPEDGDCVSLLVSRADLARHRAKQVGRGGRCYFEVDMVEGLRRRDALQRGLRQALRHGEFHLCYQPKLQLSAGRICGWEALLRWRSEEFGEVSPAEFVPVAEAYGLVASIGDWVLREACRQLAQWQAAGVTAVTMAVNVSPHQLRVPGFAETVASVLAEHRLSPAVLELEITETAVMEDIQAATGVLMQLAGIGVGLAMDDFGTGHSSLAYLRSLPVGKLKIDRSFIAAVTESEHDAAIVRAIIALAQTLKMAVVAEGVETEAQRAFLDACRCDELQGYLLSRPLLPADCAVLLGIAGRSV